MNNLFAIAIDGPSGSGKSTVAKVVATKLNFVYIDTGAMYRTIALYFFKKKIDITKIQSVLNELEHINMEIRFEKGIQVIYLDNEDVAKLIRTQLIADFSSKLASIPEVRHKLVDIQKKLSLKY